MTKQELLIYLHKYSPEEEQHLKNKDYLQNSLQTGTNTVPLLSNQDSNFRLHRGLIPTNMQRIYIEGQFFDEESESDIQIIQHDRYTEPYLHSHEFYELFYVYEGEFHQNLNGNKLTMHTGDFCLIPPGVYHALDVHNYSIVLNILISKNKFQEIILSGLKGNNILSNFFISGTYSANVNDYIIFHTYGDLQLQDIVLDMCLEFVNQDAYFHYFLNLGLMKIFGLLLRDYEKSYELPAFKKKKDSQNFAILLYFEQNYKTITLASLAEKFHYSPQYMSNRVKQITGLSFSAYLLQKRMDIATDLLINTTMKVHQISEEIGYVSHEHFIRSFRKFYHMSPSAYRSSHQKLNML